MLGLVCVLCVAAVLGRPGFGSTNSDLLCRSTKPPSNAQVWDFSLVLDQTGDEVLCDPFFLGLAQQMSNAVDIGQLGFRNATRPPLSLSLYCYENSDEDFLAGSCVKGLGKLFSDIAALPGSSLLALRYVVRRGTDQNGNVVNNWRQQFSMPLWAPVVTVVGLLLLGGILLFVLLLVLPRTGAGNPKF